VLAAYNSPARVLPSIATQRARQQAIPEAEPLMDNLRAATAGLPLRAERLSPFVDALQAAKRATPLTREALAGSSLLLLVDALLLRQSGQWTALLPLRAPGGETAGGIDAERVRAALPEGVRFLDLKKESNQLYAGYLNEAIVLSLFGALAITLLLLATHRSPRRVARLLLPLGAALLLVVAGLLLAGKTLTLLHLVGLLLAAAVGSNYALFFDRRNTELAASDDARTLASLLFANLTTVAGFGLLAISSVPILQAIGGTVGPGALLSLVFAAILMPRRHAAQ
jgi:predicted exporter